MKTTLGLRLSHHLALTPQLQQSIRLLQMSTAELEQEIEKWLAENPLLEAEEAPDRRPQEEAGLAEQWAGSPKSSHESLDDASDWASQRAKPVSLQDALHEQAMALTLSERDRVWLDVLIDSLDDDGYLRETLAEIEAAVGEEFEEVFHRRLDADEMELGITLLQSMEPAGVGARSLSECLLLQLRGRPGVAADLARRLIAVPASLEALARKDFTSLCKILGCDRADLKSTQLLIQSLNPRPGKEFLDNEAQTIIPDVIAFKKTSAGRPVWQVRLNQSAVPRLSVNPVYAGLIAKGDGGSMTPQLQEARWMIKNIQQRFDTILRVSQAIAEEQQLFFEEGELAMKPLVLREIAQRCELHESTVSRVTTNKYMLTPKGTFELKYFFTSHVATHAGGTASSTAIRARIRQWIGQEDPRKPLSDQQLADRFSQEGIQVARRTIAKYREALRIDPVSQRKKL